MGFEKHYVGMANHYQNNIFPLLPDSISLANKSKWIRATLEDANKEKLPEISEDLRILLKLFSSALIGLVCVRPEMYHKKEEVVEFLSEQGIVTEKRLTTQLNLKQAIDLNRYTFEKEDAKYSFCPKVLITTSGPMEVLLVRPKVWMKRKDFLYKIHKLKGKVGVENKNTLRGSIVLNSFEEDCIKGMKKELVYAALDPLGFSRRIVNGEIGQSDLKEKYLVQFMDSAVEDVIAGCYSGVHAAHPNEIGHHLLTILRCVDINTKELPSILYRLPKKKSRVS